MAQRFAVLIDSITSIRWILVIQEDKANQFKDMGLVPKSCNVTPVHDDS